jgi:hypothetical protein
MNNYNLNKYVRIKIESENPGFHHFYVDETGIPCHIHVSGAVMVVG